MKNVILLITMFSFIISLAVVAQPRFTPQERLKMLKERLSLTDEQSAKVEKILINSDKEMKNLRDAENQDRTEFRKIMENSNQEILKILSDKQKTEYNKMLEERRNRSGDVRGGRENDQIQNPNKKNN